jgi:hypothetical protein
MNKKQPGEVCYNTTNDLWFFLKLSAVFHEHCKMGAPLHVNVTTLLKIFPKVVQYILAPVQRCIQYPLENSTDISEWYIDQLFCQRVVNNLKIFANSLRARWN